MVDQTAGDALARDGECADPWRIAEWTALPDGECFIAGCEADETDPRGPIWLRDGSMHKACTGHWESIFLVLGEQASGYGSRCSAHGLSTDDGPDAAGWAPPSRTSDQGNS